MIIKDESIEMHPAPNTTGVLNLEKILGQNLVIKGLSMSVSSGEFVAILGPSGCGKTTLLRCIAGLENPTKGKIWINGSFVFGDEVNVPPRKREIGMVFQSYACWPHMTVYGNVAFPLKIRQIDERTTRAQVEKTLRLVGLTNLGHRYPSQLSGGQQQRVALARSLSYDPKLLLLDEPLSNLDANLRIELRREIRRIQRDTKITTLYVTHDKEEAFALADRLLIMREGNIIEEGPPDQMRIAPRNAYSAKFLDSGSILYGIITRSSLGRATVKLEDFYVEAHNPYNMGIGANVGLFLPKQSMRIEEVGDRDSLTSAASQNFLIGQVVEIELAGGKIEVQIKVASQILTLRMLDDTGWSAPPGTKVCISVFPEYARVLEIA